MSELTAVVHDASQVATVRDGDLQTIADGAVAVVDGEVAAVGPSEEIASDYPPENASHAVEASGKAVILGFVDGHTHAVFAGDRSDEFAAKLRGKTYQEIMAAGGGILRSVRATRAASDQQLLDNLLDHPT